jgi:hypothetical protein
MKRFTFAIALAALPAAVFAANANTSIPGGNQNSTFVITKSGLYVLEASRVMTDNTKNAIEVTVPDVTIDLNGCTVSFSTAANGTGVGIDIPTAVNVEIRNGSVSNVPGCAVRSDAPAGSGLRLIDLRIAGSRGITSLAKATLVDRCHIIDTNTLAAVRIGGVDSVVRECQIVNVVNNNGIIANGGSQLIGNVIDTTSHSGILIGPVAAGETGSIVSKNMIRRSNQASQQWYGGMNIYGSGVVVAHNNVHDCKGVGIGAYGSNLLIDRNHIVSTSVSAGGAGHAILSQLPTTIVRDNTGTSNAGNLLQGPLTDAGGNVGN